MPTVRGTMDTDRPERYAKQLLGHWEKRGPVTTEDGTSVQRWETGQIIALKPGDGFLEVTITIAEGGDAARFAQVVKEQLDRFGRGEELGLVWHV